MRMGFSVLQLASSALGILEFLNSWILSVLAFHFLKPLRALQYLAGFAAIRWTDDAFALHHVENPRRPAITQTQAPLQSRCRSLSQFQNHPHGVLIHGVFHTVERIAFVTGLLVRRRGDQERLVIIGTGLFLPELNYAVGLGLGHKRPVNANQPRRARRKEQHVA